jgi:hypothetical protein
MNGPDYVQWGGFYEVDNIFYSELTLEAEPWMAGLTVDVMNGDAHNGLKDSLQRKDRAFESFSRRV